MKNLTITKSDVTAGHRTTIPKEIRKEFKVQEGMQVVWYAEGGEVKVYFRKPVRSIQELRGFLWGGKDLSKKSVESYMERCR